MTLSNEVRRPLTGAGFLHFAKGYDAPLATLDAGLERCSAANGENNTISDALIVLPEAFNIGKAYYDNNPPSTDPAFLSELSQRSIFNGCSLVAGLIVDDCPGISPPYSSAYLVDGAEITLLSRKVSKDIPRLRLSVMRHMQRTTPHAPVFAARLYGTEVPRLRL